MSPHCRILAKALCCGKIINCNTDYFDQYLQNVEVNHSIGNSVPWVESLDIMSVVEAGFRGQWNALLVVNINTVVTLYVLCIHFILLRLSAACEYKIILAAQLDAQTNT